MSGRFHSVVLQDLLDDRDLAKRKQLRDHSATLTPKLSVNLSNSSARAAEFTPVLRASDAKGENNKFNDKHVEVRLSQHCPGLQGLFLPDHHRTMRPYERVAYYGGYYMLECEHTAFEELVSHTMGVDMGLPGRNSKGQEGTVYLAGDATSAACQALNKDRGANCKLMSYRTTGVKSVYLQCTKVVRPGDELFIKYNRNRQAAFAVACFYCHTTISTDQLTDNRDAFRCSGFIDGSPCPHHVHRHCVEDLEVVHTRGDYCHFCSMLSEDDDEHMHPAAEKVWVLSAPVPTTDPSVQRCICRSNLAFATVLFRAQRLNYEVIGAAAIAGYTYTALEVDEKHEGDEKDEEVNGKHEVDEVDELDGVDEKDEVDEVDEVEETELVERRQYCNTRQIEYTYETFRDIDSSQLENATSESSKPDATSTDSSQQDATSSESSRELVPTGGTHTSTYADTTDSDSEYVDDGYVSPPPPVVTAEALKTLPVCVEDCIDMMYTTSTVIRDVMVKHCTRPAPRPRAGAWVAMEDEFIDAPVVLEHIDLYIRAFELLCDRAWESGSELERLNCPAEMREVLLNSWLHLVLRRLTARGEWTTKAGRVRRLGEKNQLKLLQVFTYSMWDPTVLTEVAKMLQGVWWSGETGELFTTAHRGGESATEADDPNYDSWWDDQRVQDDAATEARGDCSSLTVGLQVSPPVVPSTTAVDAPPPVPATAPTAPRPSRTVTTKTPRSSLAVLFANHPSHRPSLPNGTFCAAPADLGDQLTRIATLFSWLHVPADGACGWHSIYYAITERWLDAARVWDTAAVDGRIPQHLQSDRLQKSADITPLRIMQQLRVSLTEDQYERLRSAAATRNNHSWVPFTAVQVDLAKFTGWQLWETVMMAARQAGINLFVLVERTTLHWEYHADRDNQRCDWQYGTLRRNVSDNGIMLCSSTGEFEFPSSDDRDRNTVFLYLYHVQSVWADGRVGGGAGADAPAIHGHWTVFIDRGTKQSRWSTCSSVAQWLLSMSRPQGHRPSQSSGQLVTHSRPTLSDSLTSGDYLRHQRAHQPVSHVDEVYCDAFGELPDTSIPMPPPSSTLHSSLSTDIEMLDATTASSALASTTAVSAAVVPSTERPSGPPVANAAVDQLPSTELPAEDSDVDMTTGAACDSEVVIASVLAPASHSKKQVARGEGGEGVEVSLTSVQLADMETKRDAHHAVLEKKRVQAAARAKKKRGKQDANSHTTPRPRKDKQCELCNSTACSIDEFIAVWKQLTACCLGPPGLADSQDKIKEAVSAKQVNVAWAVFHNRGNLSHAPANIYQARLKACVLAKRREQFIKQYGHNLPADMQSFYNSSAATADSAGSVPDDGPTEPATEAEQQRLRRQINKLNTAKTIDALQLQHGGVPLCRWCWCAVNAVKSTTFDDWVTAVMDGKSGQHANTGKRRLTLMEVATTGAITDTVLERACHAPDDHIMTLPVHSLEQLHALLLAKLGSKYGDSIKPSLSTIKRAYRRFRGRVKLMGQHHTLAKCSTCHNFQSKRNPTQEEVDLHEVHQRIQQNERTEVELAIHRAVNDPDNYLCLAIDGMDQQKTELPHLAIKPKWLDGNSVYRLGQKVTGVLAWGINLTFAYLNSSHIQSRGALTIHIIMDVLRRVWKMIGDNIAGRLAVDDEVGGSGSGLQVDTGCVSSQLPSTSRPVRHRYTRYPSKLILLMDNSGKDNKNNSVFSYLAHLVQRAGMFVEVKVHFLIVGHTHDRVDQFFSCISRHLHTVDVWTVQQLHEAIRASYGQHAERSAAELVLDRLCMTAPEVIQVYRIADWSDFFTSRATKTIGAPAAVTISQIATPQVFRITMNPDGDVLVETKPFSYEVKLITDKSDVRGRAVYQSVPMQWSTGSILLPYTTPVPFLDPLVAAPSHPLDIATLREATVQAMEASDEFKRSPELHRQWSSHLDTHEAEVMKGVCSTCADLRLRQSDVVVLGPAKLQDKSAEEVAANSARTAQRARLEADRKKHAADLASHAGNIFHGLWSHPFPTQPGVSVDLQDRVLAARSLHALRSNIPENMFSGCLSEEQVDKHHAAWKQHQRSELEERRRRMLQEIKSMHKSERARQTAAHYNDDVAGAQARSDKIHTGAVGNSNMHRVSADPEGRDRRMGELSVVDTLYQRRNLPIHLGDIVAVILDNFQWPEYHVGVYLVCGVIQPSRSAKAGRGGKRAGSKRERDDDSDQRSSAKPAKIDWHLTSKGNKVCSADFHDKHKARNLTAQLINSGHDAEEVERLRDKYRMHGDEQEDENIYEAYPFYLQYPTHKFAVEILNAKIANYIKYGDTVQLQAIADKEERRQREQHQRREKRAKRRAQARPSSESEEDEADEKEVDAEDGSDADGGEYVPSSTRPVSNVNQVRRRVQERLRAERAANAANVDPAATGLSLDTLNRLKGLGADYVWTRASEYEPDDWNRVFTAINDLFVPAKPSKRVLRGIQPMYGLRDYESRQLSLRLLHERSKMPVQSLRKNEILAWSPAHMALDSNGFFVEDFLIKVEASVGEYLHTHHGWYADDSITSSESDGSDNERGGRDEEKMVKDDERGGQDKEKMVEDERRGHGMQASLEEKDAAVDVSVQEAASLTQADSRRPLAPTSTSRPTPSHSSATSRPPPARSIATTGTPQPFGAVEPAAHPPPRRTRRYPERTIRPPERLNIQPWTSRRSMRTTDPIDPEAAQVPIIPGGASTLGDVMPSQLPSGVVVQQRDELPSGMVVEQHEDATDAMEADHSISPSPSATSPAIPSPSASVNPSLDAISLASSSISPTTSAPTHSPAPGPVFECLASSGSADCDWVDTVPLSHLLDVPVPQEHRVEAAAQQARESQDEKDAWDAWSMANSDDSAEVGDWSPSSSRDAEEEDEEELEEEEAEEELPSSPSY